MMLGQSWEKPKSVTVYSSFRGGRDSSHARRGEQLEGA